MSDPHFPKLQNHVFICTNQRPPDKPRPSCCAQGAEDLIPLFKDELKKRGLTEGVRVQRAGCLDTCELGVSMVIYPQGVWYGKVTAADIPEIVEAHFVKKTRVERLLIPGRNG